MHPDARCLACGYVLCGLPEARCPECGRPFDPDNPATYGPAGPKRRHPATATAMYVLPLLLATIYRAWFVYSSGQCHGIRAGLAVIDGAMASACGPLILLFLQGLLTGHRGHALLLVLSVWCGWFTILWRTRLSQLPWGVHLLLGLVWCLLGTAITAGVAV
jgi:hypothetical protein